MEDGSACIKLCTVQRCRSLEQSSEKGREREPIRQGPPEKSVTTVGTSPINSGGQYHSASFWFIPALASASTEMKMGDGQTTVRSRKPKMNRVRSKGRLSITQVHHTNKHNSRPVTCTLSAITYKTGRLVHTSFTTPLSSNTNTHRHKGSNASKRKSGIHRNKKKAVSHYPIYPLPHTP